MEPEEKKPDIIDVLKEKEKVASQLDTFINPSDRKKNENIDAVSYYSGSEIKTEPMEKIKETSVPDASKITRPIVRTYQSDVEKTIQTGHISSVNIAIAQNKKILSGKINQTGIEKKKFVINKNIIFVVIVLILAVISAYFIPKLLVQMQYSPKPVPVETVPAGSIMTVDLEEKINLSNININRVATTLKERVDQSSTQLGQIKNIYLTEGSDTNEKVITASRFIQLINATVPDQILRTLKDPYMFGLYNFNGNQRFLILKVGEYDTTFSGMLMWEKNLWQDFKEIFELPSDETTLSSDSLAIEVRKFQDATFNNKDARVVKDTKGNIIFLYSIIDNNTVVITTSTDTLKEVINRISKSRVVTQ